MPLNEGLIRGIKTILPNGLLNPPYEDLESKEPAVVGGNTEVSQRLTDTLLKAFELAACSQGTMNNLLFGNENFGYYETICGGVGAGPGFHGADAVHQHMTNTRITDPEIMELRYPVRLLEFKVCQNSGGLGKFNGGNGIVRKLQFMEDVTLTVLLQHGGGKGKRWVNNFGRGKIYLRWKWRDASVRIFQMEVNLRLKHLVVADMEKFRA